MITLIFCLIILTFIALALAVFGSAWFKGKFGEFLVNAMFRIRLPKWQYQVIHNVTLPTEDGTTQIDHIVLSIYGVFVVETKNMKGWIYGSEKQPQWTQKIYRLSNKFQNPLHQNYKHTQTLGKLLNLENDKIFSLVVFVGDSTFKTPMPDNVAYGNGAVRYIRSKTKVLLNYEQIFKMKDVILTNMLERGFKTDREHTRHVRAIVGGKSPKQ